MPRRAKDPLTAATTLRLLPVLRSHGFHRRSTRLLGRLGDCVFQLLDFQKTSYGGGDFCVNYASMMLVPPEDHIVLQPGGRLRHASGGEAWWPSATYAEAETSMQEVLRAVETQALPFFDATRSVGGAYSHLMQAAWGSQHHLELARGVCLAWMDDRRGARAHLDRAAELYEADGREWCAQYRARALGLMDALVRGSHATLLRTWRAETVAALKLGTLESLAPAT